MTFLPTLLAVLLAAGAEPPPPAPAANAPAPAPAPAEASDIPKMPGDILVTYFSDDDYPPEAVRKHQEGAVTFVLLVGADGAVKSCSILVSSGWPLRDDRTCELASARIRFRPAHDSLGRPVEDRTQATLRWRLH